MEYFQAVLVILIVDFGSMNSFYMAIRFLTLFITPNSFESKLKTIPSMKRTKQTQNMMMKYVYPEL